MSLKKNGSILAYLLKFLTCWAITHKPQICMLILECLNRLKNRRCWFLQQPFFKLFILFLSCVFTHPISVYVFTFAIIFETNFCFHFEAFIWNTVSTVAFYYWVWERGFTVFIHPQHSRYIVLSPNVEESKVVQWI